MKFRRIPSEYLGAFKGGHRKATQQFIDDDFSHSLLDRIEKSKGQDKEAVTALLWLTQFNNEHHKNVVTKDNKKAFHPSNKLSKEVKRDKWGQPVLDKNGKEIYLTQRQVLHNRENSKNRDIMTINNLNQVKAIVGGAFESDEGEFNEDSFLAEEEYFQLQDEYFTEDEMIDLIDRKENWEALIDQLSEMDEEQLKEFKRIMAKKVSNEEDKTN